MTATDSRKDRTVLTDLMYVTLYVTDQDRALTFCTEQLGLEKRIDFPNPGGRFLTVGVPGTPVELLLWALDRGQAGLAQNGARRGSGRDPGRQPRVRSDRAKGGSRSSPGPVQA
ncbi:hypothetical protein ACFVVA_24100 [Kitasatospora sp. NPDC058048]|uniref:hypothetical protein n=1 Tax=Kitasatospora sp. NPDC058048 TaxID=3346313 RepID=UPI0036D9A6D9